MAEISTPKSKGEVNVFDSEEELAVSLAKHAVDVFEKTSKSKSSFTVVISGGSLVKSLRYVQFETMSIIFHTCTNGN